VNPEDVPDLRLGQTVVFRTEGARPETIASRLSHISPEVDEKTRRVRVHSEADNRDGRLRPNAFGTARILIREHSGALVVPSEAVQSEGSIHLVFVRLSETSFHAREVRPGLREGDLLEVTGVRAGEEVVTTGSFMLKSELVKERIAGDE